MSNPEEKQNPMVILADSEGQRAIKALCDIALKTGGLRNLPGINAILCSIKPLLSVELDPPKPDETSAEDD